MAPSALKLKHARRETIGGGKVQDENGASKRKGRFAEVELFAFEAEKVGEGVLGGSGPTYNPLNIQGSAQRAKARRGRLIAYVGGPSVQRPEGNLAESPRGGDG